MDLEFLKCKDNQWVPIVNGTLLHSTVDPYKEARDLIDLEWDRISTVQTLIVFGIGGGYHIEEILSRKSLNIVVVEAEKDLAQAMAEKKPELFKKIEVLSGFPPAQIYLESKIISALSSSYAILLHPASMRVSSYYYNAVSQVLNQRTLVRLRELSQGNPNLNRFLKSLNISEDQILTLPMVEEAMARQGSGFDREGLIWMTMRELVV